MIVGMMHVSGTMTGVGRACRTLIVPVFCRGHQQVLAGVVAVNVKMCHEFGLTASEMKTETMYVPERLTAVNENELDIRMVSQRYANK